VLGLYRGKEQNIEGSTGCFTWREVLRRRIAYALGRVSRSLWNLFSVF